jgi:DNA-binding transcriptional MerR regulator
MGYYRLARQRVAGMSIGEMAEMVGCEYFQFYDSMKLGLFPEPTIPYRNRKFYTAEQVEEIKSIASKFKVKN